MEFIGFDWDEGNRDKNWKKHRVSDAECEEVFFHQPLVVRYDPSHSGEGPRYRALGQTAGGRKLFVAFTMRDNLVRVVSGRKMTAREEKFYGSRENQMAEKEA